MENDQTPNGGGAIPTDPNGTVNSLKGKTDEHGIPLDPEEARDYYRRKFSDSSRGAQELLTEKERLARENEEMNRKIQQLEDPHHKEEFVPKSELEETNRKLAELQARQEYEDNRKLVAAEIAELVKQEEFKPLQSHKKALLEYAYEGDNVGAKLPVLARSFMVERKLIVAPKEEETPRPGLEGENGSTRTTEPKKEGYTSQEAEDMRKNDPRKYMRLTQEGKMNIVDNA